MSFVFNGKTRSYNPGYFLADAENAVRLTQEMAQDKAETAENGGKFIPMGTIWPSNDASAAGIVYEDVDVSTGNMPGSVVVKGVVYKDRLPVEIDQAAQTALENKGFVFIEEPEVERPY